VSRSLTRTVASIVALPFGALVIVAAGLGFLLARRAWTAVQAGARDEAIGLGIGALLFLAAPFTVILAGMLLWQARRGARAATQLKAVHPHAPWTWRGDWAEGRVDFVVPPGALWFLWGFALFWYGFLAVAALLISTHPTDDARMAFGILAVFAAAGVLILAFAVRATWHRARFGRSTFDMDSVPFPPGGWVSGVVHVPPAARKVNRFNVALDCVEVWDGSETTHRAVVWREEATVEGSLVDRDSAGAHVPVCIAVPPGARETCGDRGKRIEWQLRVNAVRRGLDYDASFEVPVFASADAPAAPVRLPSLVRPAELQPAGSRIRVETGPAGAVFQYPSPSWLFGWIVGPLLLVPAAALIGRLAFSNDAESFLVSVAVGVGLALFLLAITAMGVFTTPNRVEVRDDCVAVRRGLFGRGWDRRIPREDIVAVRHVPFQNGSQVAYSIDLSTRDGRSYSAALSIKDLGEAKWLAAEIERQARRPG